MADKDFAYSATPTKNPLRYALALLRFMRSESNDEITSEVAIIEIGFARSRFGRRLAQWEKTIEHLKQDPLIAEAIACQDPSIFVDLDALSRLPTGTLGNVLSEHCTRRGINPNLVEVPVENESDWLLDHLYRSHDIWHVITGWSNDGVGEVGLGGFYCGQLRSPSFFVFLLGLIFVKAVLRREDNLDDLVSAFSAGYQSGKRAKPLFPVRWDECWDVPLAELRKKLNVDSRDAAGFGEGILAEAA